MLLKKKRREKKGDGEKKVFYVQYFLSSLLPGCVFLIFSPFSFCFFLIFWGQKILKKMEGKDTLRLILISRNTYLVLCCFMYQTSYVPILFFSMHIFSALFYLLIDLYHLFLAVNRYLCCAVIACQS